MCPKSVSIMPSPRKRGSDSQEPAVEGADSLVGESCLFVLAWEVSFTQGTRHFQVGVSVPSITSDSGALSAWGRARADGAVVV